MIFDSLGLGELGVIFIVAVLFVDPKKLGKLARGWAQFKRKWNKIQAEMKSQLDILAAEDEAAEKQRGLETDKVAMRRWGREQVRTLTASTKLEAAQAILRSVTTWPTYQSAKVVSCFVGTLNEVDTDPLLRQILTDGKTLLVPYIKEQAGADGNVDGNTAGKKIMGMAVVADLEKDLHEGEFHIQEPRPELRLAENVPAPDLVIVPGTCFDLRGGRLGKGMGFYDAYLAGVQTVKLGLCFDVQIARKNLALDARDQYMDALASEKRFQVFSGAQVTE